MSTHGHDQYSTLLGIKQLPYVRCSAPWWVVFDDDNETTQLVVDITNVHAGMSLALKFDHG